MADLLMLCAAAASELQERRKADSAEHGCAGGKSQIDKPLR